MEGAQQQAVTLGKYRLLAELGHGGMAQVFLALSKGVAGFNKLVVIKQIHAELAEDPDFVRMFLDEARLAARLNHPNVVQTNEVDQDGRRYFIAMEYLEGQTLNRVFNRMGRDPKLLPLGHRLRLVADSLAGLHYAHELKDYDGKPLGVVHRDMTPHNIFVTYNGVVKVVDFGIAKALNSSSQTQSGVLKGKVSYMAPEQARGERVDRRADLFSVGMILWQVATGKRLYRDLPELAVIQKICNGDVPKVGTVAPFVPPPLQSIIDKALAPERDDRYATALELQNEIEGFLDQIGARISTRDIGELVAKHFAEERSEIQGIVDEQLRREVDDGSIRTLPNLETARSGSGHSESGVGTSKGLGRSASHSSSGMLMPPTTETAVTYTGAGPHARARQSRQRLIGLAAAGALVLGGALALGVMWPRSTAPGQTVAEAASDATAKRTFHLRIESTPAGASVREGGTLLGTTPLVLPVEPDSSEERQLVVEAEGFQPYVVKPGKLTSDLTVLAPLVAASAAGSASGDAGSQAGAKGRTTRPADGGKPAATATAATGTPLDIRVNR